MSMRVDEADEELTDDEGNPVLRSGQSLRVPLYTIDHAAAALHRPGYRIGDGASVTPEPDAGDIAYEKMRAEMQDLWRTPQQRESDQEAAAMAAHDQVTLQDAQAIRDAAYERYCASLRDGWKS